VDGGAAPLTSPYTFAPVTSNHTIDVQFDVNPPVAAIATLTAAQVSSGNDGDGTIKLRLHWDDTLPPGATVEVYRARFGQYPEYDDAGGAVPGTPIHPPASPWAITAVAGSDQDDEVNHVSGYDGRDVWYYAAFVKDQFGTYSPASNLTVGRPNYLLGDVSDGTTPGLGRGNNVVDAADLSALGDSYGLSGGAVAAVAYLDVGPTQDFSVATRPSTDNVLDFEDLVMFAINFDVGALPRTVTLARSEAARGAGSEPAQSTADRLRVTAPERVSTGQEFKVELWLECIGRLQAVSAALRWEPGVVEPVVVEPGEWLTQQGGVVFSPAPGAADAALLGVRPSGLAGGGLLAVVRFRAVADGEPGITLATLRGRDRSNRAVDVESSIIRSEMPRPTHTELSAVFPNPIHGLANVEFSLAEPGRVSVTMYGVDGRAVRRLSSGAREAGRYRLTWDGRDDSGRLVPSGIYFVHMTTAREKMSRRVVFVK
jgi:hypothetical protein